MPHLRLFLVALLALLLTTTAGCARRSRAKRAHLEVMQRLPASVVALCTLDGGDLIDRGFAELGRMLQTDPRDEETRREMGAWLKRTAYIDPMGVDVLSVFVMQEDVGVIVSGALGVQPPPRDAEGAAATENDDPPPPEGMMRLEPDLWYVWSGGRHVLGTRPAVEAVLAVARGEGERLAGSAAGAEHGALTDALGRADVLLTIAGSALDEVEAELPGLTLQGAGLAMRLNRAVRGVVHTDEAGRRLLKDKLTEARNLARLAVEAARMGMEQDALDPVEGLAVIYAHHHVDDLFDLLTPREKGEMLVLDLHDTLSGGYSLYLGSLAAIAIPSFMRYKELAEELAPPDEGVEDDL
jgi:hypothetical protein